MSSAVEFVSAKVQDAVSLDMMYCMASPHMHGYASP